MSLCLISHLARLLFPVHSSDESFQQDFPISICSKSQCDRMWGSALKTAKGYYVDGGRDILATPHKDKCTHTHCTCFTLSLCLLILWKLLVWAFRGSSSPSCASPGSVRLIPCLWGGHYLGHTSLITWLCSQSHLLSIHLPNANWLLLPQELPLPSNGWSLVASFGALPSWFVWQCTWMGVKTGH